MSISGRFGRIFWLVQHKHTQWVQGKPPTKYVCKHPIKDVYLDC